MSGARAGVVTYTHVLGASQNRATLNGISASGHTRPALKPLTVMSARVLDMRLAMFRQCFVHALGVLWECLGNTLGMFWQCTGNV